MNVYVHIRRSMCTSSRPLTRIRTDVKARLGYAHFFHVSAHKRKPLRFFGGHTGRSMWSAHAPCVICDVHFYASTESKNGHALWVVLHVCGRCNQHELQRVSCALCCRAVSPCTTRDLSPAPAHRATRARKVYVMVDDIGESQPAAMASGNMFS